ncbi:FAD dependent oxidoreductase [Xylariaceae sp. FL1019]|nr:FAD dependent oxidoreductase [Xylariaceae sp. FL1019]
MGAVHSLLSNVLLGIKTLLQMNADLQDMLKRANASPGLPISSPTNPYWLEDPPYPELVNIHSKTLPQEADIVIIGSGITGAAVARSILYDAARKGRGKKSRDGDKLTPSTTEDEKSISSDLPRIVVLEARSLCSGATGRNGGHIKASPHELFAQLRRMKINEERAAALVRFQLAHLDVLTSLCEAEGWDAAECRKVETTDMYLTDEDREKAFEEVHELRKWVPELKIQMWDSEEAHEKFQTNAYIKGAISYTAGALWPFRFVSCVWKDLLDRFESQLSLEMNTPVTKVEASPPLATNRSAYAVTTDRGTIRCNQIVHATNGFTTQFVPGLKNKMTGILAHMSAQRPGKAFPDLNGERSWSIFYNGSFDYVTQRPSHGGKPGDIMLGGGFSRSANEGLSTIGIWDDSKMDALPVAHISGIFPTVFEPRWGAEGEGGRIKSTWSGIVCPTGDLCPFVGPLDPKLTGREFGISSQTPGPHAGEWVAAGYSGDGMVWAWLSGTAVGLMLNGSENEVITKQPGMLDGRLYDWFPRELEPTAQRLKKANLENLLELLL